MKRIPILFCVLFLMFSCSFHEKKITSDIKIDYKVEFDDYFASNYTDLISNGIEALDTLQWTDTFYRSNNYSSIWINDSLQVIDDGLALIDQLSNAKNYGLDTRFYGINSLLQTKNKLGRTTSVDKKFTLASQLDIRLTYYYMLHGKHLNYGLLPLIDSVTVLPRKKFTVDLPKCLLKAYESDSIMENLLELQPKHQEYHNLQKALVNYLEKSTLSTRNINLINFRVDSLKSVRQAKKALISHKYLPKEYTDSMYFDALTKFQIEHGLKPDSLIGKNTAKALSMSTYEYYQKIVANLERWRWKEAWGSDYLYVNIPSYKLQLIEDKKLVKQHKVIVGKIKNQTPEIIDTLEYIIAYPYWHVPRKISVKEILVKVQKDSTYLTRNNYEVMTYSREELDPKTIEWSEVNEENFNYLIRQKGGSSNSLGLVKFIFPNQYAIYLHDTPTKYYFEMETRAYSHGCVRVQKALDLAEYLLKSDNSKYNLDSIYSYIEKEKEKPIKLKRKIPVHLYYFTSVADSLGNITFYDDVYGSDRKLMKELTRKF